MTGALESPAPPVPGLVGTGAAPGPTGHDPVDLPVRRVPAPARADASGGDVGRVRFRDLGTLLVDRDGDPRSPGGARPAAALSLLLIHANRRVSCETLMEAMWGDQVRSRSPSTLESHIWRLRGVVEPDRRPGEPPSVVLNDSGGYRLVVGSDRVDSLRFGHLAVHATDLLAAGEPDRALRCIQEALALWRGRPYTSVADALWAAPAVSRLEELHAQLRELHIDALLALGRPGRALVELEPLIREQPLREGLWGRRMTALHRCGRTDQALTAYRQARDLLREEIGAEPGAELRELQRELLADGGPRAAAPPRRTRPLLAGLTRLIGRSRDLDRLDSLRRTARCLTVTGPAGCGKSRLAAELARLVSADLAAGAWSVDLAGARDTAEVVEAVCAVVGVGTPAAGSRIDALRSVTRDQRMLILLDNCDHVLDAAGGLAEALLAAGPGPAVLATAREPLGVDGEVCWALSPLALPGPDEDDAELGAAPAVELFVERATAADPELTIEGPHLQLVAAICRALDGLPLAIELAATRARAYGLHEIAAQVTADPSVLGRARRGPVDRHDSIRSAVDWSHQLLSHPEMVLHRRLSVFPGSFTAAAAATVAGAPPLSPEEVGDLLVRLVYRSLLVPVVRTAQGEPSRFAQLATVRGHAAHALAGAGESDALSAAHARWVRTHLLSRGQVGNPG